LDETDKEYTWIIDPLDGTTNFVHGVPTYAVSVGLMYQNEIVLGVIHEVNHNESFYAWKNGGAFLNENPIHVTDVSEIEHSLFATGFPSHNFEKIDNYLTILNGLMKECHGLRRIGSAATDLAYVACGRYEGFFEHNLKPWDVAAGIVIVKEAGGKVSDFSGGENVLFGREIVAAGLVHSALLKSIQAHW
jgi:myo-inositol-1(or 4)-monophosphatase